MENPVLLSERRQHVLILTFNRPEVRNALNAELIAAADDALVRAEEDPEVRVVVVTGSGSVFCAGMDLQSVAGEGGSPPVPDGFMRLLRGRSTVPVVGAANGTAVAGGLEVLLGCDLVVASSSARFGLPEVKRGLFAGSGVLDLALRVPLGPALEMALTGDLIGAERAREIGLVNDVVEPHQVMDRALEMAARVAANAPLSLAATKELVRRSAGGDAELTDRWRDWIDRVFKSDDAREGARAFLEKRDPRWTGR